MAFMFPSYFLKVPIVGASPFQEVRWRVFNRTGGALEVGRLYCFDVSFSQAETTNGNWMDAASCWRNIVTTSTQKTGTGTAANPSAYTGYFCIATETAADNAETEVVVSSPDVNLYTITGTNGATSFFPRWSGVVPLATQNYATIAVGSQLTTKVIGRTNAGVDMGSTSAEELRSVMFNGFGVGTF